jgi:hypothetical protein
MVQHRKEKAAALSVIMERYLKPPSDPKQQAIDRMLLAKCPRNPLSWY